jgi:DNA-directed RNA polymerase specialized sigma24 family protein
MHENRTSIVVMGREMKRVHGSGPAHEEIERVYRERRLGFLAWAVRRGADAATAEDIVQDAFGKAVAAADAL